jgi:hypothetical protein
LKLINPHEPAHAAQVYGEAGHALAEALGRGTPDRMNIAATVFAE